MTVAAPRRAHRHERDAVADWATRRGISFTTYRDLTERPEVVDLVAAEVRRCERGSLFGRADQAVPPHPQGARS